MKKNGKYIKCKYCGKYFYVSEWQIKRGVKYCSKQCYYYGMKKRKFIICQQCGKKFDVSFSKSKKRKFCSRRCYNLSLNKGEYIRCELCKKKFYIYSCEKNKRKYCSQKCFNLSEVQRRENRFLMKLPQERKKWLYKKYQKEKLTIKKIAKLSNCSEGTIYRYLILFDIETRITGKKGWKHTNKTKEKLRKMNLAENNPQYGKHLTEEHKKKIGLSNLGKKASDKTREKLRKANLGENNPRYGKKHTEEYKTKMSKGGKNLWRDPLYINKQRKSRNKKIISPNKSEKKLQELLNLWFPNEFKYVGDFQVVIEGKCPDFININGKKQIIEIFGDYWHSKKVTGQSKEQHEQQRINHFSKYGYKTLIIWECELGNIKNLKNKIQSFY